MAGVVFGDVHLRFAVQAWHLATSTFVLRGRCGTCGIGLALVALGRACAWARLMAGAAVYFAWQAEHLSQRAGSGDALGGALGRAWSPVTPRYFVWQAWHLAASTFTLRGRRGTWRHPPSLCVASVLRGMALMALGWLWWRGTLRGRHGTWRHSPPLCVAGVALMAAGWRWRAWARLVAGDAAVLCVAGVALGGIYHLHFAWQAWHLATSTITLRGRCGAYGIGLALVARLGALGRAWSPVTKRYCAWQVWHLATSTFRFSKPTCRPSRFRSHKSLEKTVICDFSTFSRACIFFLLILSLL